MCSELVTIVMSELDGEKMIAANLEEIGSRNVRVLVDVPMPYGTHVSVKADSHCLKGRAGSSAFEPYLGYYIDIQLDPDSQWSIQSFKPQHLVPSRNRRDRRNIAACQETVAA